MKKNSNMPYKDGTGPEGKGSRTGRGLGSCEGSKTIKTNNNKRSLGLGLGFGSGRGSGFGRRSNQN